jgi:hypothetical protein
MEKINIRLGNYWNVYDCKKINSLLIIRKVLNDSLFSPSCLSPSLVSSLIHLMNIINHCCNRSVLFMVSEWEKCTAKAFPNKASLVRRRG